MADNSKVRKRLAEELKIESAKLPTPATLDKSAGKLTKFPPVLVDPPAPLEVTALS